MEVKVKGFLGEDIPAPLAVEIDVALVALGESGRDVQNRRGGTSAFLKETLRPAAKECYEKLAALLRLGLDRFAGEQLTRASIRNTRPQNSRKDDYDYDLESKPSP